MSSASSGRYQSRLFNFIHQQSRRVTEQCQRALRHVQVATSSVAPVVLYPLYLLFHSAQEGVKQLRQATQTSWLRSPVDDTGSQFETPTADLPIQQVLLLVDNLPTPSPLSHSRPTVRGIATQLLSRTLVLVTAQNEILDILTLQQQQKLQERIIQEVAQYWRLQRLAHQRDGENTSLASTILKPELSGVGTKEKHSNRLRGAEYPSLSLPVFQTSGSLVPLLDRSLAELESKLVPVLEMAMTLGKHSQRIIQQVRDTPSLHGGASSDFVKNQQLRSNKSAATADGSENQTFRIQALIWAAIDYFFGDRAGRQLRHTPTPDSWKLVTDSTSKTSLPSPRLPPHLVSSDLDAWLTISDLFGEPEREDKSLQQKPGSANQKTSQVPRKKSLTLPFSQLAIPFLPRPRKTAKTAATLTSPLAASVSTPSSISPLQAKSVEEIYNQPYSHIQHEPAAEWIDIDATAVGYVKHPLEQLLEWLDGIMLWLEEVLMIVWRWMRSLYLVR